MIQIPFLVIGNNLYSQVTEVEGARRTKEALDAWIANQENVVAEMLKRPAKLRADAAQLEINMVSDMKQTLLAEKQAALDDVEARMRAVGATPDHNSKIALDTLDEHITMLLDKRYSQQAVVEDYRAAMQEAQSWIEAVSRALDSLDGMTVDKKAARAGEVHADCEGGAEDKLEAVREKAEAAAREVGDMDRQNVQEQTRSVERRVAELRKRVERRKQGHYSIENDVALGVALKHIQRF